MSGVRKNNKKLWEKDYELNKQIEDFTVGNDYMLDRKLVKYDCLASIAHVKMLGKMGILKQKEVTELIKELTNIINLDAQGKFIISKEEEDCHTAIENHLTEKLGALGKKIHTARSRNDQVLAALRLYYKDELKELKRSIVKLNSTLKNFAKKYEKVELPGYTHTRKAMPSSISMWTNAFIDSMRDNLKGINFALNLIDQSPLGTGAGYGIPIEIDKKYVANLLNFKRVQKNPIYVQHSRGKFESTILHVMTQIMFDLNKISTDLILFSMPEFGYFELPEEFCTGSSIMPHKRNPDVLELIRANHHIVVSYEIQTKTIISNLPSGYNRDVQLTKQSIMDAFKITKQCLSIMSLVFTRLVVNKDNCKKALTEEIYATEEVYNLVKKGMPFRDAYRVVSEKFIKNK